jgi:fatty-acyl-CoA synthase
VTLPQPERGLLGEFLALCQANPQAPCLRTPEAVLTRSDLRQSIAGWQTELDRHGFRAGDVVGLLAHNRVDHLSLLLACAGRGLLLLPMNWRLSAHELDAIAAHAGCRIVWHDAPCTTLATQLAGVPTSDLPDAQEQPATGTPAEQPDAPRRDVLLVYTSGTTGEPKGAVHTQAGMLANVRAALAVQPIHGDSRVLSALPLFHVGGLCIQTLPALLAGAQVMLLPRFEADAWFDAVRDMQAHTSLLVPATMRALIEHRRWPREPASQSELRSLQFINSGSSIVPTDLLEAFHRIGIAGSQVYGATETGPVSIALPPDQAMAHVGSAGMPAPGVQVRLVNATGHDVGADEVGEIWLRADNLMRCYWRQDPAQGFSSGGWLPTGDLARRDAQGLYWVVGRSKDMIISGGENIYPAEIENLLTALPVVKDCALVGLPDSRWGEVPVLAVVLEAPATARQVQAWLENIGQHLARHLARYKLPRQIVPLAALPRTALGKVQKTQLRQQLSAVEPTR